MKTDFIARTGRVQSWLDNPESRLPVSCTVFVVDDSMEGENGIEASWRFASHALRNGAGVAIHLSKLRGRGLENGRGLVASGPVSFAKIYSTLNEVLRRGGVYKNGAVVAHLDINHPDIVEFVTTPRNELPWIKRCVNLSPALWELAPVPTREAILGGIRKGDIWLNKIKHNAKGERIYGNVCLEVYLPSRGTCLLQHVNLGACGRDNLIQAFVAGMTQLCNLHGETNVDATGEYLSPLVDRQVGLGMLGLANMLANHGVTYKQFGEALELVNGCTFPAGEYPGLGLAVDLQDAISAAARMARYYKMDRAFAIAPTATCSYRYKDSEGFTTCPEIAPPISRHVDRDSGTFGVEPFDHGPVETASDVGWDDYKRVADNIALMLHNTGLFHGYSFNSWSDVVTYDDDFIDEWLNSPQTSLYYSLQVMEGTQDKTDVYSGLDPEEVEDYLAQILEDKAGAPACNCRE